MTNSLTSLAKTMAGGTAGKLLVDERIITWCGVAIVVVLCVMGLAWAWRQVRR